MSSGKPSRPKSPGAALDAAMELFRGFLSDVNRNVPEGKHHTQITVDDKTVFLDRNGMRDFHRLDSAFERFVELRKSVTLRTVRAAVERSLVNHLADTDANVDRTVRSLREQLSQQPRDVTVYVPVVGFDASSVPGEFGGVPIRPVHEIEQALLEGKSPEVRQALGIALRPLPRTPPPVPGAVWEFRIQAAEPAAAREAALELARRLVDVLHFFARGHHLFDEGLAVAAGHGRPQTRSVLISVDSKNGDIGITPVQAGSGPAFYLNRHSHNWAWQPANEMLAKTKPNKVESLLLTSMAWAGRATKEARRDLAFTQFAIALESLMVPKGTQELTERLSVRVARLLAGKLMDQSPAELYREVKHYYSIRSKIVHDGTTDISNVDLFRFHWLVKWAMRRMIRVCYQLQFQSVDELDDWLTGLTLGSVIVPEPQAEAGRGEG